MTLIRKGNPSWSVGLSRWCGECLIALSCIGSLLTETAPRGHAAEVFTYSYSNLFDGGVDRQSNLSEFEMLRTVEESLALWASVAPLTFVEVADVGPEPTDNEYSAVGTADIRIGHHDLSGNTLGHAYFPGSSGLASDVHLDSSDRIWSESLFFTTVAHELGHALGLDHIDAQLSLMNSTIGGENLLPSIDRGSLFMPEIAALQGRYGSGAGEVITERTWAGGESTPWLADANWQEGWRPTEHANVQLQNDGLIEVTSGDQAARSLTLGAGINQLSIESDASLAIQRDIEIGQASGGQVLLAAGAAARISVPRNSQDQETWFAPEFDDGQWQSGPTGIGYDRGSGYEAQIATDVEAQMYNQGTSVYARLDFTVQDPSEFDFLQLDMKYDDGFVAYLNGVRIAAANAPTTTAWNAAARNSRDDAQALAIETFDLSAEIGALQTGRNVLAIQGLNNRVSSSDLLLVPILRGGAIQNTLEVDGGQLVVGGSLTLAAAKDSESILRIAQGEVTVSGNLSRGDGESRIELRGGLLRVEGGAAPEVLLDVGATASVLVPTQAEQVASWAATDFDDSAWEVVPAGLGYDRTGRLAPWLETDLEDTLYATNASVFTRFEFQLDDPQDVGQLDFNLMFDDGFVAYLNGQEVARANAPAEPSWDSAATRSVAADAATSFVTFDLTPFTGLLVEGGNLLAIQGLNSSASNSDLLLVPQLVSRKIDGTVTVGTLEFFEGEIEGVSRLEGTVEHRAGVLSPPDVRSPANPFGAWTIVGDYHMQDAATLEITLGPGDGARDARVDVQGVAQLAGTLALVTGSSAAEAALTERGAEQQWTVLQAELMEGEFASIELDGNSVHPGHQGAGRFQQLIYGAHDVRWVTYLARPGDADGNGQFDSRDLVAVFQSGQYEDPLEDNSDWTTGDWNLDLDFDSTDLVLAFQGGQYESTAAQPAPEPPGLAGLALAAGLSGLLRSRRFHAGQGGVSDGRMEGRRA